MLLAKIQKMYLSILKEELILATGCTEPIAIAYAAAQLRDILEKKPEKRFKRNSCGYCSWYNRW